MGPEVLEWKHEVRDAVEMMAELPNMWDVNVADWANDSKSSRFAPEGLSVVRVLVPKAA